MSVSDGPDGRDRVDGYWLNRLSHYLPVVPSLRDLLHAVVAHTPRLVSQRLLDAPQTGQLILSLEGTVMFADLDGFTPLAERFSQLPADSGAEELTDLVNRFMAILIETSRSYGGDLLKFGGDAGLLYFGGESHATRAVSAADSVQRMMRENLGHVDTSLGEFALQAAIGIGTGRLLGLGVGDQRGSEFLLLGPPLGTMGHAQSVAPPGETVVDAATVAACDARMTYEPVGRGYRRVVAVQGAVDLALTPGLPALIDSRDAEPLPWYLSRLDGLSPYLSPGLLQLLVSELSVDSALVSSDRRLVTVLMVSLADLGDPLRHWGDPKALLGVREAYTRDFISVRDAIGRYDGVLNKVAIGPGGAYLVAVFGAPRAHEDDPLRAVLAALEIQEAFGYRRRIGVNTGYVFAGDVGTADRREYTVMGDEVNLAARLMSRCPPGAIWLGPNTGRHPAVEHRLVIEHAPPTRLRGKSAPIRPLVVRSLRQSMGVSVGSGPSLVGREEVLSQLGARLSWRVPRDPQFVVLHGEAGVGKSVVASAVMRAAVQRGVAVHAGAAPSYGDHLPFAGWDRVLSSLLGLEAAPADRRQEALEARLDAYGVGSWSALIAPIVGVAVPVSVDVLALPPRMRDVQRQSVLLTILTRAAQEKPRLLVFDNVQWMSAASLELLEAVVDALPSVPLDIVLVARDEVADRWRGRNRVLALRLGALSGAAMHELVAELLGGVPAPASVADWIVERSEGLPIFATEAVRSLIASGRLVREGRAWILTGSLSDVALPDMVYALIQSRIDQLDPPSRHLLRAAAAVGDEMTLPVLAAAYGEESEAGVQRRLPVLAPFGLLQRGVRGQYLVFTQPLVREVAYRGLPHRVQVQIHERLTGFLGDGQETVTPNWLTLLAHHAFEGGLWARAMESNLELGRQAVAAYLAEQARNALIRVLAAADAADVAAPDARFEAHYLLSGTLTSLGLYEEALSHLGSARQIDPQAGEAGAADRVRFSVARTANLDYREATVLEAQARYSEALGIVVRGLDLPGVSETIEGARLWLVGADLQRRLKNYKTARAWAGRALDACPQSPDTEAQQVRSRAMTMMALLASLQRLEDTGARKG